MTVFVPGEITDAPEALRGEVGDLVPAAFDDRALDRAALFESLDLNNQGGTPAFSFFWPLIETARVGARSAATAALGTLGGAMRIRFGEKHFAAAPRGAVYYTKATDHSGLQIGTGLGGAS